MADGYLHEQSILYTYDLHHLFPDFRQIDSFSTDLDHVIGPSFQDETSRTILYSAIGGNKKPFRITGQGGRNKRGLNLKTPVDYPPLDRVKTMPGISVGSPAPGGHPSRFRRSINFIDIESCILPKIIGVTGVQGAGGRKSEAQVMLLQKIPLENSITGGNADQDGCFCLPGNLHNLPWKDINPIQNACGCDQGDEYRKKQSVNMLGRHGR